MKICENLSHFVKICEMHTPREAPACIVLEGVVVVGAFNPLFGRFSFVALWVICHEGGGLGDGERACTQ